MESVYIHIPFCQNICSYCDFCKVLMHGPWVTKYLNALVNEIKDKYHDELIKTIYIGGGTPSALSEKDLKYLFDIIGKLKLADQVEFTFECNVNDLTENLLKLLSNYPVNRLSIGVQSFNSKKLAFMERNHTFKDVSEKLALVRQYHFNNINLDLIYGIPGETIKDLKKDLRLFLKLKPEHISTYSLIVEDNTKIGIAGVNPISEDLDRQMYDTICRKLATKKYLHYEVSNFAKKGYAAKHNLNYWHNLEYYGFGVGAHGYTFGVRYENTRSLTDYFQGKYVLKEEMLSKATIMENELLLGLRKSEGINLKAFFDKFELNMQEVFPIKPLLKSKDLIYKSGYIFINPERLYTMNEILIKMI